MLRIICIPHSSQACGEAQTKDHCLPREGNRSTELCISSFQRKTHIRALLVAQWLCHSRKDSNCLPVAQISWILSCVLSSQVFSSNCFPRECESSRKCSLAIALLVDCQFGQMLVSCLSSQKISLRYAYPIQKSASCQAVEKCIGLAL